jgi:NTP pyrophosphatase (non-canonical NTP hydrolase)
MSSDVSVLLDRILRFRDARDWKQFHTLKNLAAALSVEAAELLELTQWKTLQELEGAHGNPKLLKLFEGEVADVLIYLLLISEKLGIDPVKAAGDKLLDNEERYPVEKSRGSAKKYSEL